jgi:hypothetical protein
MMYHPPSDSRRAPQPRQAAAAVEFAVVAIPLVLIVVGLLDFGRVFMVQEALNYSARAGARAAAGASYYGSFGNGLVGYSETYDTVLTALQQNNINTTRMPSLTVTVEAYNQSSALSSLDSSDGTSYALGGDSNYYGGTIASNGGGSKKSSSSGSTTSGSTTSGTTSSGSTTSGSTTSGTATMNGIWGWSTINGDAPTNNWGGPNYFSYVSPGDQMRVTVSVLYSDVSWVPTYAWFFSNSATLQSQCVMRRN